MVFGVLSAHGAWAQTAAPSTAPSSAPAPSTGNATSTPAAPATPKAAAPKRSDARRTRCRPPGRARSGCGRPRARPGSRRADQPDADAARAEPVRPRAAMAPTAPSASRRARPRSRRRHDALQQRSRDADPQHQRRRRRMEVRLPRLPARADARQHRTRHAAARSRPSTLPAGGQSAGTPINPQTCRRRRSGLPAGTARPASPATLYTTWNYTNTVSGPWTQLNFSYGNSKVSATVIVDAYNQTDGSYRNAAGAAGDRSGVHHAELPRRVRRLRRAGLERRDLPESLRHRRQVRRRHVRDVPVRPHSPDGRDADRQHSRTSTRTGDWTFTLEQGIGAKIDVVPFLNNAYYQVLTRTSPSAA